MGSGASKSNIVPVLPLDFQKLSLVTSPPSTPAISPRLAIKTGNFLVSFKRESDTNSSEKYLCCSESGVLHLRSSDAFVESWRIRYLDLDWPQQYFRVYNNLTKSYICAKLDGHDDTTGQPIGSIYTIQKSATENQTFDKSFIFYLSPSNRGDEVHMVNTMFGMSLYVNESYNIILLPTPDEPTDNFLWKLQKSNT